MKITVKRIAKKGRDFNLKANFRLFFAKEFFHNSIVQWLFIATTFLNLISWGLIIIFIRPSSDPIWLHYNVYFGVDVIGDWWQAYILPSMGMFFLLVNFMLGFHFFKSKERIATHLLLLTSLIVQIGIIIAVIPVVIINSSI